MKVIDLLNKIANGEEVPNFWWNCCIHEVQKEYGTNKYSIFDTYCKKYKKIELEDLNDEIKFLEEEKELHANNIEFNINNDKRDCIITLDENGLGIDKLHLDNCYFYKENDKWYVKKYDFKNFNLEEEKKIPKKLNLDTDELRGKETPRAIDYLIEGKINEVIDYLKNKGE